MVELKPTNLHTIWVSYLIQSILFINPVAMGSGMTILRDLRSKDLHQLNQLHSTAE